jgi:hypothetical protein
MRPSLHPAITFLKNKQATRALSLLILVLVMSFIPWIPLGAQSSGGQSAHIQRHKYATMRGTVLVFTPRAITIRDLKNFNFVRTFSFAPKLLPKMQKRHYKWGDRVKVKYFRGSDVAVSVK